MSINPQHDEIDTEYERLRHASLNELSRLIPRWSLGTCGATCECELLILRSSNHPNAVMLAAGRLLAERLGFPEDMVSWQPLELHA